MSYTTKLTEAPPTTVTAGEPFSLELEVCCTNPDGCRDAEYFVTLGGHKILRASVGLIGEFCIPFPPDAAAVGVSPPSWIQFDGADVVVTQPGTYTLSWPGGSQQLTVEEPQIDPALVDGSCAIDAPDSPSPGDQITLTETLSNANSKPVDVSLTFSLGGATQTRSVTVPANGSATPSATFTAESEGTLNPKVEFTVKT